MSGEERICVGAILGAFGVKGEVRLKSFCAEPEAISRYNPLSDEAGKREFKVKITRPVKGGFGARIEGIRYRDQAEALKGVALYAPRSVLPNLPDDEFYHSDLIGLEVFDTGGEKLGKVDAVHDHGAGDMLHVKGKIDALVPFTRDIVPTVDLTARRIVVDPPPGLFPGDKADTDE